MSKTLSFFSLNERSYPNIISNFELHILISWLSRSSDIEVFDPFFQKPFIFGLEHAPTCILDVISVRESRRTAYIWSFKIRKNNIIPNNGNTEKSRVFIHTIATSRSKTRVYTSCTCLSIYRRRCVAEVNKRF